MRRPLALAALLALCLAPALPALAAEDGRVGVASVATFANDAGIAIADGGPAAPYPSTIEVAGVPGEIADLDVRLSGFRPVTPDAVDVLLVGPRGQTAVIMSDAGGDFPTGDVTLTLDDEAEAALPMNGHLASGTFRPANYGGPASPDAFPAPAPAASGGSALSAFHGTNPNGTWRLYVVDDYDDGGGVGGSLAGWSLQIAHAEGGPPIAKADAFRVKEDRPLRRAAPGVLANDADPDDGPLIVRLVSGPGKGTLTLGADGSFAYKPKRNFAGTDRFVYEVEDAQGFADRATATITVLAQPG